MRYLALVPCPKTTSNSSPGIGGALQICTKRVGGCWQRLCRYGAAQAHTAGSSRHFRVLYLCACTGIIARASPKAAWRLPLFGGRKLEMEKANQPFSRRRIVFFPRRANFTSPTPDPAPLVWASHTLLAFALRPPEANLGPPLAALVDVSRPPPVPLTLLSLRIGA